jgi:hypothetical protein
MEVGPERIRSEKLAAALAERDLPCHVCGHNLRGLQEVLCPECGTVVAAPVAGPEKRGLGAERSWARWWRWGNTVSAVVVLVIVSVMNRAFWTPVGQVVAAMAVGVVVLHVMAVMTGRIAGRQRGVMADAALGLLGSALVVLGIVAAR